MRNGKNASHSRLTRTVEVTPETSTVEQPLHIVRLTEGSLESHRESVSRCVRVQDDVLYSHPHRRLLCDVADCFRQHARYRSRRRLLMLALFSWSILFGLLCLLLSVLSL